MSRSLISTLPTEVWLIILSDLDVRSFLNLIATSKALYDGYLDESSYWYRQVHTTFRVAPLLVAKTNGARWRKMYKRLKTESQAYGWGQNARDCLNQAQHQQRDPMRPNGGFFPPHHLLSESQHIQYPRRILSGNEIGNVSDMQCGGWSTSLLTTNGAIHVAGVLDSPRNGSRTGQQGLKKLQYPSSRGRQETRYDASTAVRQYSHGRDHILALSDDGSVWTWRNERFAGLRVKFLHHDVSDGRSGSNTIKKVVAGWGTSAALLSSTGIVVWQPVGREEESGIEDAVLVLETGVVPLTASHDNQHPTTTQPVGNVVNFIVLETMVVFVTTLGKVFVSNLLPDQPAPTLSSPIEIDLEDASLGITDDAALDVQGSFRSFSVFTKSGAVLLSKQSRVSRWMEANPDAVLIPRQAIFSIIPALQNTQVIAMAFGDWHFHALHAQGHITSYGTENYGCGSFGFGGVQSQQCHHFRGCTIHNRNRTLLPQAYTAGRSIWFEDVKREWYQHIISGGVDPAEAAPRLSMAIGQAATAELQADISDWIEQESRDWESKYQVPGSEDDLPAYFAWTVCAAGWHSGALVLVDQKLESALEHAVRKPVMKTTIGQAHDKIEYEYKWAHDHFPRLRLRDGTIMPGECTVNDWRYERPEHELDGIQAWLAD